MAAILADHAAYALAGVVSNVIIYLGWGLRVYDYPMAATSGARGGQVKRSQC